jgi:hypothetical protein
MKRADACYKKMNTKKINYVICNRFGTMDSEARAIPEIDLSNPLQTQANSKPRLFTYVPQINQRFNWVV